MYFKTESNRPYDLISMGRVAVDLYAEQIFSKLKNAQSFRKYLGGCAGNIAVGTSRMGLRTRMLSCVGADEMGEFLCDKLVQEGVDIKLLQKSPKYLTGLVLLGVNPPDNFPLIFYRNDCADINLEKSLIKQEHISSAKSLLVTGTGLSKPKSKAATIHAINLARESHTKIILDIDYRPVLWGEVSPGDGETRYVASKLVTNYLQEILPLIDFIVGTEEEIKITGGDSMLDRSLRNIRKLCGAPIVLKKGESGCEVYGESLQEKIIGKPYPVPVLNVLGAGDAFMSGLVSALLSGQDFSEAMDRANAAGAIVVSRHGCAPAIPSLDEIKIFKNNFPKQTDTNTKAMASAHLKTNLKNHKRKAPMPVLAFCHRWQFEESSCSKELIKNFKTAVGRAALIAAKKYQIINPWILTDPDYGSEAIQIAEENNMGIIVPIERSGLIKTEWLEPRSAYEILRERPSNWGVKILWHYHPSSELSFREHQLEKLSELFEACKKLERYLMIELLLAPGHRYSDQDLINSLKIIYQKDIQPYWWKIPALDQKNSYQALDNLLDTFDKDARILILGGSKKPMSDYRKEFSEAKSSDKSIGFAVGRSIFWDSWLNYSQEKVSLDQVSQDIAEAYQKFFILYQES